MRSTFKVLFYLKRDKQKTNGLVPLFCRITVDGKESRFSMKCDVNPKYWDVENCKATGRTTESVKTNTLVENTKAAIHRVYRELQERDNYVTAEKIRNVFLGVEQRQQTLLELFDRHNSERELQKGITVSKSTCDRYRLARRYVAEYVMYKYSLHDIAIKEVNLNFITGFETWLLQRNCSKNYVISLMKKFRHIIEFALDAELIYKNPFKTYRLQWQNADRGYLTQAEINTLIDFCFEKKTLEQTRDIFVFCMFTGLSYADVRNLEYDNIQKSFDGKPWIRGKRRKTGTDFNIPLLDIPQKIIEKYRNKTKDGLVLPVYSIDVYNKFLKEIGKHCGISKKMSSHLARHTFATLALTKGVSIESVSKMLGHCNIRTTQIYARITNGKIAGDMAVFAEKITDIGLKINN